MNNRNEKKLGSQSNMKDSEDSETDSRQFGGGSGHAAGHIVSPLLQVQKVSDKDFLSAFLYFTESPCSCMMEVYFEVG